MQMNYSKYGYTFKLEQLAGGQWSAVGHAKGKKPFALTKLGTAATEYEMQRKLASWARHVLAVPVLRKAAVMAPESTAVELELFPQRMGCLY